jgi:hypothetical protein
MTCAAWGRHRLRDDRQAVGGSGRRETAMEPLILLGGLLAGGILVWLVIQPDGG